MMSNSRERILAILVGVTVVGYLGFNGIQSLVIVPYKDTLEKIDAAQTTLKELQDKQEQMPKRVEEWQAWTAQTLALNADDAQSALRDDLNELLLASGLTNPRFSKPRPQKHLLYNNRGHFEEVLVPVTVSGRYPQLVTFLKSFYQQGYLSSLRKLNVKVQRTTRNRSGKSNAPTEPTLEITCTAAALVLPKVPSAEAMVFDPNQSGVRLAWLKTEEPEDARLYEELKNTNVFKKWVKPKPPAPKKPEPRAPKKPEPKKPEKPEPKPIPPPTAPERTLVGVENFGGRFFAYVRDDVDLTIPLIQLAVGDRFDDGELLFVDRDGVVVRGPNERTHKPEEAGQADWFYPLGKTYEERAELTREIHPRVYDAFQSRQASADDPDLGEVNQGPASPQAERSS